MAEKKKATYYRKVGRRRMILADQFVLDVLVPQGTTRTSTDVLTAFLRSRAFTEGLTETIRQAISSQEELRGLQTVVTIE